MKKSICLILALSMLLGLLSGCYGAETPEATPPSSAVGDVVSDATPDPNGSAEPAGSTESAAPAPNMTVSDAVICRAAHEDPENNRFKDRYEELSDDGWIGIDRYKYYVTEVFPTVEFTPEEVVESYRTNRWNWGYETRFYSDANQLYLWNADFSHMFMADLSSNWLFIDGVQSWPLDQETHSIAPEDLVRDFQSGDWRMNELRRSSDFSTEVTFDQEYGFLAYDYHVKGYDDVDPEVLPAVQFAFTGFDEAPWWRNTDNLTVPLITSSQYDGTESDGSTYARDEQYVLVYPDVPWNEQESLLAVRDAKAAMAKAIAAGEHLFAYPVYDESKYRYGTYQDQAQRNSDGLYAVTTSGIKLWRGGLLRQTWDIPTDSKTFLAITTNVDGDDSHENCVYSQGKIYRLLDDGTTEVVLDRISSKDLYYRDTFMGLSLSPDGILRVGGLFWGARLNVVEIATDVKAAILDDDIGWILYTTTDGETYAVTNGLYPGSDAGIFQVLIPDEEVERVPLGQKTIAEVKKEYKTFCEQTDDNYGSMSSILDFLKLDEPTDSTGSTSDPT